MSAPPGGFLLHCGFCVLLSKKEMKPKGVKMSVNASVVYRGIANNPYVMTVLEQTREGKTIKRLYYSPNDISPEDKMDFLLVRIVNGVRQNTK